MPKLLSSKGGLERRVSNDPVQDLITVQYLRCNYGGLDV